MIHRRQEPGSFTPDYLRGEPPSIGIARTSEARESALSVNPSDGTFAPAYLKDQPYSVLRESTGEPTVVAHAINSAREALRHASEVCFGAGVDHDSGLLDQISDYLQHVKESARIR